MFGTVALTLHDHGWRPLPCNGKAAVLFGWNELCRIPWDRAGLIAAMDDFTTLNCGIAADEHHVFLDLDISDVSLAHAVVELADQLLDPTPLIRIGLAPKCVRIYRNASSGLIRSHKLHPIEVMCGSGQIVVFGLHPTTQRPYTWPTGVSPLTLAADSAEIPVLDHTRLGRFLSAARGLLTRPHYVGQLPARPARRASERADGHDLRQALRTMTVQFGFEGAAKRLLRAARLGNRHMTAFTVATSAAGRGWNEAEVRRLFDAHFAGWDGVSDDAFRRILDLAFNREN
jgi:hypothetical protein